MARPSEAWSINPFHNHTMVDLVQWLLSCILLYTTTLIIYRLKFHHAAHIPGPLLAKLTFLYGWYYDLYLGGQYAFKIKELHQIYGISTSNSPNKKFMSYPLTPDPGPIIRIDPDIVHIDDPDYFEALHNQKNGRHVKPPHAAEMFGPYPAVCLLNCPYIVCHHRDTDHAV